MIGIDDWFHHWLVANAARFGYQPYAKEAWHWVYRRPAQGEAEASSEEAAPAAGVQAGRVEVAHVPMLARHRGKAPDLVLRWNDMPSSPAEVDVVVHLHGYSRTGMTLPRDIERWSGLDLAPVDEAYGRGRARPTLTVLRAGTTPDKRHRAVSTGTRSRHSSAVATWSGSSSSRSPASRPRSVVQRRAPDV